MLAMLHQRWTDPQRSLPPELEAGWGQQPMEEPGWRSNVLVARVRRGSKASVLDKSTCWDLRFAERT